MRKLGWWIEDAIGWFLGYTNCRVCGRTYWRLNEYRTCVLEQGANWSYGTTACFTHRRASA